MKKLNADVIYEMARKVAEESTFPGMTHQQEKFNEDPELWVVGFFLAALARLQEKSSTPIGWITEEAGYEDIQEEARKLLKRKKVTTQ